jgi:hypothetical protein
MNILVPHSLLILLFIGLSTSQNCNENESNNYDSNWAKIISIGNNGRKFPVNNGEELTKYCRYSYE